MNGNRNNMDLQALSKMLGGGSVLLAVTFLVLALFMFKTFRIERVSGEEVGFLLNRITGKVEVLGPGTKIFNGLVREFYVLDKTLQTIDMTETQGRGDRKEKDDLKIKTKDGSDVWVDMKVQYRINPDMLLEVLHTSGPKDNYKKKWARDYTRSIIRNFLGELSTEEFYDSSKRDVKLILAENAANERLKSFGIIIDSIVIPQRPHFYKEYEDMIKRKKLADQAVLEEQSKALAAKQKQHANR